MLAQLGLPRVAPEDADLLVSLAPVTGRTELVLDAGLAIGRHEQPSHDAVDGITPAETLEHLHGCGPLVALEVHAGATDPAAGEALVLLHRASEGLPGRVELAQLQVEGSQPIVGGSVVRHELDRALDPIDRVTEVTQAPLHDRAPVPPARTRGIEGERLDVADECQRTDALDLVDGRELRPRLGFAGVLAHALVRRADLCHHAFVEGLQAGG